MNVERFADRLEQVAAECEARADMHAQLGAEPEHHEADNALLVEATVLRRIAQAARDAA